MVNDALVGPEVNSSSLIQDFIAMYQSLNKDNLHLLADVYSDGIIFTDPMHQIHGLAALQGYFANLYHNVQHIHFEILEVQQAKTQASLFWLMEYAHPQLNKGKLIRVDGMSQLKYTDKIYEHRDYFDLGQMLYERLPLIGAIVRLVKERAAKS